MSSFTGGKWELDKHMDIKAGDKYVALVSIIPNNDTVFNEETKANARLIVSAPLMYELLSEWLEGPDPLLSNTGTETVKLLEWIKAGGERPES